MSQVTTNCPRGSDERSTPVSPGEPWDGEAGWPRPRHVPMGSPRRPRMAPACFVQSDPADPLSAEPSRLQRCFTELLCQVCGEPVLAVDSVGWVLHPAANMGGACCTRCMYLAIRTCPRLSRVPEDEFELWAVTSPSQYRWHVVDGVTLGKVVPALEAGALHDWTAFRAHHRRWRAMRDSPATCSQPQETKIRSQP